ncbi:hypothetical protein L9F63_006935, partial [Diploptera punctata]
LHSLEKVVFLGTLHYFQASGKLCDHSSICAVRLEEEEQKINFITGDLPEMSHRFDICH